MFSYGMGRERERGRGREREREREIFSLVFLLPRALIPFMKVLPTWLNYLPKAPPLNANI